MSELLRIGNNSQDRSLFEQWVLNPEDDPTDVLARLVEAARNHGLVELKVSKTTGGPLRDLVVNPYECSWWDLPHTDKQKIAA